MILLLFYIVTLVQDARAVLAAHAVQDARAVSFDNPPRRGTTQI